MTDIKQAEWRQLKRTTRARRHQQRMEQVREAPAGPWLAAVERDDIGDPVERDAHPEVD